MDLATELTTRLETKPILLMTHLVVGYPSLDANRDVIAQMAANGVDCIELQIPFSEPTADGPVILKANQQSLNNGTSVEDCFRLGQEMAAAFPLVRFLFMTYYNIVFKYGEEAFLQRTKDIGFCGTIVADLPPEEGETYLATSEQLGLAPIQFFTPTSTDERMHEVAALAKGFIYCVARRGVTGKQTTFDDTLGSYLARCKEASTVPLAVGFGISNRDDVAMLQGKADMAVIGTATIKLVDAEGPEAVGPFIAGLLR
ncbi:tryptophan synthase subunit alpha [Desulfobulbus rhabdoformis]|uniref:tryptophan synthase subunit alpha n=1 Tax=Desulfobulbus rhabdoformis TaxID=34032 RepID=UPI001962F439|nr:tryptophan synthase subunit alpha [Desulfobulbus rhabdoformis]MBM9612668.1 tryptophan synthase subunit alpha [Desulfobulbus rhabdoformis]